MVKKFFEIGYKIRATTVFPGPAKLVIDQLSLDSYLCP